MGKDEEKEKKRKETVGEEGEEEVKKKRKETMWERRKGWGEREEKKGKIMGNSERNK